MKVLSLISLALLLLMAAGTAFGQTKDTENGIVLYREGKYDESAEALQKVVESDKANKLAWLYLGASYVKQGKEKEAVKAFRSSKFGYEDLRNEQKSYETPLKLISKPRARYTDEARSNNVTGTIKIAVEYEADGSIGFAIPVETLPHGLTQNALQSARQIRFQPAVRNGNPVTVVGIVEYTFSIY